MGFFRLPKDLNVVKGLIVALADTVAQLVAGETELKVKVDSAIALIGSLQAEVADLQAQIASLESLTPEQIAELQTAADGLTASNAALDTVLPPPAPPAEVPAP